MENKKEACSCTECYCTHAVLLPGDWCINCRLDEHEK